VSVSLQARARPSDCGAPAAVRRVDWRFLLPDRALGRVAYLAPHDVALTRGLLAAGAVVDLLAAPAAPPRSYDLVVVTGARRAAPAVWRSLLVPGGWLYIETPGRRSGAFARALRGAGFDEVERFWLWPRAAACREIVPLQRAALRHALGRRDPGARLRLRARAAGVLAYSGLFAFAVHDAAVIGRSA
jgi:hypothetical protein